MRQGTRSSAAARIPQTGGCFGPDVVPPL